MARRTTQQPPASPRADSLVGEVTALARVLVQECGFEPQTAVNLLFFLYRLVFTRRGGWERLKADRQALPLDRYVLYAGGDPRVYVTDIRDELELETVLGLVQVTPGEGLLAEVAAETTATDGEE